MGRRPNSLPERGPIRRGKPLSRFRIPDPFRTPGRHRAAQILYAVFSPPRFPLGDEYLLSPAGRDMHNAMLIEPGGRVLLGPSDIRLWGRYPYVYGLEKGVQGERRFLLDMKEHTFRLFPPDDEEDFESVLQKNGFDMEDTVTLRELFKGPRELRMELKQRLGRR